VLCARPKKSRGTMDSLDSVSVFSVSSCRDVCRGPIKKSARLLANSILTLGWPSFISTPAIVWIRAVLGLANDYCTTGPTYQETDWSMLATHSSILQALFIIAGNASSCLGRSSRYVFWMPKACFWLLHCRGAFSLGTRPRP
jgi:hypothetical protein